MQPSCRPTHLLFPSGLAALAFIGLACGGELGPEEEWTESVASPSSTPPPAPPAPDLVVTHVRGSFASMPGALDVEMTVCNQGSVSSIGSAEAYAVLSADWRIDLASDPHFVYFSFAGLAPGRCQTLYQRGPLPWVPNGSYYVGGVVNPFGQVAEMNSTNNTRRGNMITTGSDLYLGAVSATFVPGAGGAIVVDATLCNLGTTPSERSASVALVLSADTTIAMPDNRTLAIVTFPTLNPSECRRVTYQTSFANMAPGTYYVGGDVDPGNAVNEVNESNNTTIGHTLTVN